MRPTRRLLARYILTAALAVLLAVQSGTCARESRSPARSQNAGTCYATLIYSDSFLLGARVLGQSLRETGTNSDLVALVTGGVSARAVDALTLDGWKVRRVDLIQNPGTWTQDAAQKFPQRFFGVYTKLSVFNLTQYQRVAYLDADTIAARNMDELFLCDGLCGVMRHSERINTGVLVLTPSEALYRSMLDAVATTPSYTGGDQGFINAFFADFPEAPLFDPRKGRRLTEASSWRSSAAQGHSVPLGRLPTVYNADLGLFVMNSNRWTLEANEIRVLHFTLATFKPWDWWSGWIMGETSAHWQALRSRLAPTPNGHEGGVTTQQQLAAVLLVPLPLLIAALWVRRALWHRGLGAYMRASAGRALRAPARVHRRNGSSGLDGSSNGSNGSPEASLSRAELHQLLSGAAAGGGTAAAAPAWLTPAAAAAGVLATVGGLTVSLSLIPRQVAPALGWALVYEWTSLSFVVLFSLFLQAAFWLGRGGGAARQQPLLFAAIAAVAVLGGGGGGSAAPGSPRAALSGSAAVKQARPWGATVALFVGLLACMGLVPWWGDLLGVHSLTGKVLTTFAVGVLSCTVCTQCFISLAARWYQSGAAEALVARAASKVDV